MTTQFANILAAAFSIWLVSFVPSLAQQHSQDEVASLVSQLGNAAKYEDAVRRLGEIGAAAKAQLQAAVDGNNALIGRRAKLVLANIERREQGLRMQAFVEGEIKGGSLPCWNKLREIIGDNAESRQLYVDMYRAQPHALEAYESNLTKAMHWLSCQCSGDERNVQQRISRELSISSIATLLFVAGDERIEENEKVTMHIIGLLGMSFNRMVTMFALDPAAVDDAPDDENVLRSKSSNSMRKLIARWVHIPAQSSGIRDEQQSLVMKLMLAAEYNITEILPSTIQLLGDKRTPSELQDFVIMVIGKLGGKNEISVVEPFLQNNEEVTSFIMRIGKHRVQVCDLALFALIEMTGQKHTDYHFTTSDDYDQMKSYFARIHSVHFASEASRTASFKKWRAWAKANPIAEQPAAGGAAKNSQG